MEMEKDKELEHVQEERLAGNHGNGELHSEADLTDNHEEASVGESLDDDEHKHVEYSEFSKAQVANLIKDLSKETNFRKVDHNLKEVKPVYEEHREKDRAEALSRFIANGGVAEDFEFKGDENDN